MYLNLCISIILFHVDNIRRDYSERMRVKLKCSDVVFGIADRKRSSCFRPFKVADNTTISPRKNVADYQRCANLPRRLDSFSANRRANLHVDGCGERIAKVFTNVKRDDGDKYSTAGRSKNVVAVIRQYECNLGRELLRNVQFFESAVFTFFFPPSIRSPLRLDGNDGPGFGWPGWFHKRWKWRCKSWWL